MHKALGRPSRVYPLLALLGLLFYFGGDLAVYLWRGRHEHRWSLLGRSFNAALWTSPFMTPDGAQVLAREGENLVLVNTGGGSRLRYKFAPQNRDPALGLRMAGDPVNPDLYLFNDTEVTIFRPHRCDWFRTPVPVTCLAVSPNGRLAATGHGDGFVRFWRNAGDEARGELAPGAGAVTSLQFSPDGSRLLVVAERGSSVWNAFGMTKACDLPGPGACAFGRDGNVWTLSPQGNLLEEWQPTGWMLRTMPLASPGFAKLSLSMDGHRAALGRQDGTVLLYDLASWRWRSFRLTAGDAQDLSLSRDGARLGAKWADGRWEVWSLPSAMDGGAPALVAHSAPLGQPTT